MAGKPKLHYFNGRGRMESIRWLLAAAGVEFLSFFIGRALELFLFSKDGNLMFQQVPMVEIDGMKLVQTRAILNYIASKHNLYGKDIKERALRKPSMSDVLVLGQLPLKPHVPLCPGLPHTPHHPISNFSVGNWHIIIFFFVLHKSHEAPGLMCKEEGREGCGCNTELSHPQFSPVSVPSLYPVLKALKTRISNLPTVKKFLQPGSQRKPPLDAKALEEAKKIFRL
uniref:glutathione transferase n=1 Tax=Otolemur garnettii TaxID=30611 RepID=H0XXQ6_OTOGA